jgi:hypothetical protein
LETKDRSLSLYLKATDSCSAEDFEAADSYSAEDFEARDSYSV